MNTQTSITTDSAPRLLSAAFNQDQGCFTISYETGFRVYNTDPMELNVKREWDPRPASTSSPATASAPHAPSPTPARDDHAREAGGGIGLAQMLHRTNYLALVGGGRNPKFPQNKVVIWDDMKRKPALSLEFLSPVLNVLLSRTHIVVVLAAKVHVFAFSSPPVRIASYETADNPHGVAVLANSVLAFPSRLDGQIQIVNLDSHANGPLHDLPPASRSASPAPPPPQYGSNLVTIIRAHKGPIRCLALNASGSVIASASEMGTIIRLHSTRNTALLHEYRRGLDRAIIYSMAFSPGLGPAAPLRLAVLSDKNTLHVFDATNVVGGASQAAAAIAANQPAYSASPSSLSSSPSSSSILSNSPRSQPAAGFPNSPSSASNSSQQNNLVGSFFSAAAAVASAAASTNRRHLLGKLPLMPRYFYSEWSFVSARVDGQAGVLGWPSDDAVVIIWTDSCKWEKYVIVEKEAPPSHSQHDAPHENQFELVREAWRGFEGISYD